MASDINAEIIREYKRSDKEAVFELFKEVWGGKVADEAIRRWDWQYEINPANGTNKDVILVLECKNKIVGLICSFWVTMKIGQKIIHVLWCVDFMAHADHRGRQGIRMAKRMIRTNNCFMGFPHDGIYKFWKKQGVSDLCQLYHYKNIINMDVFLEKKVKNKVVAVLGNLIWKSLWETALFLQSVVPADVMIVPVDKFDEKIDEFWEKISGCYKNLVVRDKKYLNWRFVDFPSKKHSILLAKKNNNITGYIVYRVMEKDGFKSGLIVDFFVKPDDKKTLQGLISEVLKIMKLNKSDSISCTLATNNKMFLNVLRSKGFVFKGRDNHGIYLNSSDYVSTGDISKPEDWFFTLGDSGDMDIV